MNNVTNRMNGEKECRTRNYSFDLLRIFACFMVILNHTNSEIFLNFFPSLSGRVSLIIFILCKTGVPIFFMLSGALLLGREESYRIVYGKRCVRIVVALLLFTFLYYLLLYRQSNNPIEMIKGIISSPILVAFWYLYTYLGLLIMLPFLRKMIQSFKQNDFCFLLGVLFLINVVYPFLTTLQLCPPLSGYFTTPLFTGPVFYFLLGYFLKFYVLPWADRNRKVICLCCVVGILGFVAIFYGITAREYYDTGSFALALDNVYNLPIVAESVSIFILACIMFDKSLFPDFLKKELVYISSATFGVYLLHMVVIRKFSFILDGLKMHLNDLLAILIMDLFVFIICTLITLVLKKIPGLRKIL